MNVEKLRRLQSQVRIGGKGTARRKKKVMHQTATTDDKKLQSSLKKLSVSTIPGIEEVNIIKDDLTVIHFNNPKAQASLSANTFAVTGHGETKKIVEMLPEILPQLGQETVVQLRMFANSMAGTKKSAGTMSGGDATASTNMLYSVVEEDDVPMLVSDFDEVAKIEAQKVGEVATTNKEQPATEREQNQKCVETKGEPAEVLPTLSEVKSNEKGNGAQPLEFLNSNSPEEPKLLNEMKNNIKQVISIEKENLSKNEKRNIKATNDVGKTKEKSQPKHESPRQKVKPEGKTQRSSEDNKKPDDIALKAKNLKAGENRENIESGKDVVVNDIAAIESKKQEQVTERSSNLKDNQIKQIQQKSAKQENTIKKKEEQRDPLLDKEDLKIEHKAEGLKENEDKNVQLDEIQQTKNIPDTMDEDGLQQVKIEKNLNQKQAQKLRQQQQQKNESPLKQKNKQSQQKQQTQDNQNKPDAEKPVQNSESLPKSGKQGEKQQIRKTVQEKTAGKSVETKRTSNEKLSEDHKEILKEASSNLKKSDTQVECSRHAKEVLTDHDVKKKLEPDFVAKDNNEEKALKSRKEEVDKQKSAKNQQVEESNKNNISTIETGKQDKTDTPSTDVSIKSVALQSLESSEKMMQIVNEITKDLMIDNLNKLPEEARKQSPRPDISYDQQKIEVDPVRTEELPKSTFVDETQGNKLNTEKQKSPSPLAKSITEIVQDLGSNEVSLIKELDEKNVIIAKEQLLSVGNEIVADSPSSVDTIIRKESENNEKSVLMEQQIPSEQMHQSQNVAGLDGDPLGEQTAKQPLLAEIVQSLPPTTALSTAQIPANNALNNDKFIEIEPVHKQPTMAEILQSQPPTILPAAILSPSHNPMAIETEDIHQSQLLNKDNPIELPLDSTAAVGAPYLCQPQDQGAIDPGLSTPSTDNVSTQRQINEEKLAPMSKSPKQKASPPKQTTNAKTLNETTKQQIKPSKAADSQKATSDAKLKLVTKPQTGQEHQQQQTPKTKSKSTNNNKSTPTTPTTPTKTSPEKGVTNKQMPTTCVTKAAPDMTVKKANSPQKPQQTDTSAPDMTVKKANSPQKPQQTDTSAKSKLTAGASGKPTRPSSGSSGTTSGSAKKSNAPPATSKPNANTGVKQDISKKGTASATPTVTEQSTASTTGTTTIMQSTTLPTIENTATSNKPSPST